MLTSVPEFQRKTLDELSRDSIASSDSSEYSFGHVNQEWRGEEEATSSLLPILKSTDAQI